MRFKYSFHNSISRLNMKAETSKISLPKTLGESTRNRSLVDTRGDTILQLSQHEINFANTDPNELYQIAITVRNVSQHSQKIKVRKPFSSLLTVHTSKEGNLAAGLDLKLTLLFDSKDNKPIRDKIILVTDTVEIEIPVNVYPHVAKLEFEPFLNFGFGKIGATIETQWDVANKGDTPIQVKLTPLFTDNSAKLTVSNDRFTLEAGQKQTVRLSLYSSQGGTVEGSLQIEPKTLGYSTLQFVGNFCQFSRMISDAQGKQLTQIVIDPLFAGEIGATSVFLVNNTPQSCEYRITRKKGTGTEETVSLMTPEQIGRDDSEKLVQFSPSQGDLEAYSSIELTAQIQAKFEQNDLQLFCNYILGKQTGQSFEKDWTYSLKALLNHEDHHLNLQIKGISLVPKLVLTPTFLAFPDSPVHQRTKRTLTLENFSCKTAIVEFQNSPNYYFTPQKIKLQPNTAVQIEATFNPKIIGELNQICCLTTGLFSFPIKLFGKGVFRQSKGNNCDCEEVPIQSLQKTLIEEEISAIPKAKGLSLTASDNSKLATVHFDSYRHQQSHLTSTPQHFPPEGKKTRILHNKHGKEVKIDLNHLNPNQTVDLYPSAAKNQQEERLLSRQLTPHQLRNIAVGPVLIDIGTIFLRSAARKTFHLCNFNPKPIAIRLTTNHESFAETTDERQVLPAESHGGFAIHFQAVSEGPFKHTLQYALNDNHFFELMVTGTCILPTLTISRTELRFTVAEDDKKFEKKQSIRLENAFDYDIAYEWKSNPNTQFLIQPSSGVVKSNSNITTTVTYNLQTMGEFVSKVQQSLKLKIKHGKQVDVRCCAFVPESACVSKTTEVQFKQVALGKTYENKVVIKNLSKNTTIYKVNIPKQLENILSTTTKTGTIAGEELVQIVLRLNSPKPLQLQSNLQIVVRGSKPIELPIKANIILPSVYIDSDTIDFGSTPIEGNPATKTVTLVNDSPIPVDLELRMHNDTDLSKLLKLANIADENTTILETKQCKNTQVTCLRINPKSRSCLTLEFTPQTTEQYQFHLPLFLLNSEPVEQLQKLCRCKGIKNKLTAADKEVNFGKIVIESNEQIYNKSQTVQIRNPQHEAVNWWVDENSLAPFRLDKNRGTLDGFENTTLKIFFSAQLPGEYRRELQFFIEQPEQDSAKCYLKVPILASACFPTLYFDQPYVILPVVRLGEQSTATLQINNGGYENINLKHAVVQEFSNIDLKVSYPNGSNLGVTKKQIRVQLAFTSDKPVSFTVKLNFYDGNGRAFPINVSGTADSHTYTFIAQDNNLTPMEVDHSCHFLKHYINSSGLLPDELYEFPRSLTENEFQKLAVFLSNYANSYEKTRINLKKNCKTFFAFQYISEVIKILKAEGAFLNHIRPEMLLSYEEYNENIRLRAEDNPTVLNYFKRKEKGEFQKQQRLSWLVLFYQIFKVYSRVNPGKLKNGSDFWLKFTTRERLLLTWLEKTYQAEANLQPESKGNQLLSSLNNGEVLSALISKYTNIKVLQAYGKNAKGQKEKERRCKLVIDTFAQIGINCLFRLEDLLRSDEKEMLLAIENLYLILPSYLQKGEPILFACQFGQVVTKSIEISNPSKYAVTYTAKIEGSRAYTIDGDVQFAIDSKKSCEVKIKYISNVNVNNSPATLTLTGKAANKFTPSTFIFLLKNNHLGRISEKNIQVTANLYEQLDFNVKVTNNFNNDADFRIDLQPLSKSGLCCFYLLCNSIRIKKGETAQLNMVYLPFTCDSQQTLLVFRDEKVGEFQYEVVGLVDGNVLSQEVLRIPQLLYTNKKYNIELSVPTRNDLLIRARKAAEYLIDKLEKKNNTQRDTRSLPPVNYEKYYPKLTPLETFTAKLTSPNNSITLKSDQLVIKDIDSNEESPKRQQQKLVFDINLKSPIKDGSFTVNLRNASGTDIRKYKVTLSAIARPLRYELQLKTPLNKPLSQPLPLINVTSEKNTYIVTLLPNNDASKSAFTLDCERQITVEAKQQNLILLSFKPKQMMTHSALLKMENITTGQHIEYELVGLAEEPEAEVVLLEQEVRKQKNYSIKLPLPKNTRCNVQSFTLDNAQYQKQFITTEGAAFKFKFTPKVSGRYEGKLLVEAEQTVVAFKVAINVKNIIEGELKLRTVERKEVAGEITLPPGNYKITTEDRNLKCPQSVLINESAKTVTLCYYSSKPEQKQSLVSFTDAQLGEITYLVKIIVDAMPEIKLQPFQVELGKVHKENIAFENTDDTPMKVTAKSSHPLIFFAEQTVLVIPPRSHINTNIIYKASSLEVEEGKLYFQSDRSAKWTYHLSGYGLAQNKPEIKEMKVHMGDQGCESITFANPLNKTLPFHITLQNLNAQSAFTAILKSPKVDLAYNQQLEIPVTVNPKSVALNKAILKIYLNEKVSWRYELQAKTIYRSTDEARSFKLATRNKSEQLVEFNLPYSEEYSGQTVRLVIIGCDQTDNFLKGAIKTVNNGQSVVLGGKAAFALGILSFKPRNVQSLFEICAQNGCKWIYKCDFAFLPPAIDDKFQIVASINKPTSVKFKLTNRVKSYAKFHAYFTSQSCIDFTVCPKNGELQPYGREGTPIEVVFCPTQYKKNWSGKLVIETDDSYWSYEVRGVLPIYNPPVGRSNLKQ